MICFKFSRQIRKLFLKLRDSEQFLVLSQEEEGCNVVNHEFITSRDLSVRVRSLIYKHGVVFLFTRSIVQVCSGINFNDGLDGNTSRTLYKSCIELRDS